MLPGLILSRHFGRHRQDEDMLQEGRLELWRCIQDAGSAHTSFFNYAYTRILHHYIRLANKSREEDPLDENMAGDEDRMAERLSLAEAAGRALRKYPRQAQAVQLKALGLSYRQIGAAMGISHTTARRLCRKAAAHLRARGAI